MYTSQEEIWDKNSSEYFRSILEDSTGVFAYEDYINTPSLILMYLDKAKYVLDLGCGDGRFAKILSQKFEHVVCMDISEKMIKRAKINAPDVQFIKHDIEKPFPKFDKQFDLITCQLLLMYINNLDGVARECYNALKTNGALLISVTHPFRWFFREMTNEDIDPLLKNYFSEIRLLEKIGGNRSTNYSFIHRTFQTYINTFTSNGFLLESVSEPVVPLSFLIKYPLYKQKIHTPLRLNIKFIKK